MSVVTVPVPDLLSATAPDRLAEASPVPSIVKPLVLVSVPVPAIVVMFVAVRIGRGRRAPLFDEAFHEPAFNHIDRPLVIGVQIDPAQYAAQF